MSQARYPTFHDPECAYHADRARQEAVRAISADGPAAAAVHLEMCMRYSGRVVAALLSASRRG